MLKYRCPVNRKEVTTSIETDLATLLDMKKMMISVWCPQCVTSHRISASEAYLDTVEALAAE